VISEVIQQMEEISLMTKQNAGNASEAAKQVKACNSSVEHGNCTVIEVDDVMKNIAESN